MNLLKRAMKAPEVYPIVGIVTLAASFGSFCLIRAALKYPEVVWNRKNQSPWLDIDQVDDIKFIKDKHRPANVLVVPKY